jgi:Spy/CpxP family protein refolding chaperone
MKKSIVLASALFAMTATASSFAAQPGTTAAAQPQQAEAPMAMHKMMMQKYIPGYDQLTPEKKAIFDKMHNDLKTEMRAKMSMLMAKHSMLDAKLMQTTINKKEVDELVKEINDLETQLLQQRVDSIIKIKDATGITIPLFPKRMFMHKGMGIGMATDKSTMMDKGMPEPQNNN